MRRISLILCSLRELRGLIHAFHFVMSRDLYLRNVFHFVTINQFQFHLNRFSVGFLSLKFLLILSILYHLYISSTISIIYIYNLSIIFVSFKNNFLCPRKLRWIAHCIVYMAQVCRGSHTLLYDQTQHIVTQFKWSPYCFSASLALA